MVLSIPGEIAS